MRVEEYAEKYHAVTGENPPDNVIQFYRNISQYDSLKDRLIAIENQIEGAKERHAITQIERENQKGIRIFRRPAK